MLFPQAKNETRDLYKTGHNLRQYGKQFALQTISTYFLAVQYTNN